jgi:hypothetical protein
MSQASFSPKGVLFHATEIPFLEKLVEIHCEAESSCVDTFSYSLSKDFCIPKMFYAILKFLFFA